MSTIVIKRKGIEKEKRRQGWLIGWCIDSSFKMRYSDGWNIDKERNESMGALVVEGGVSEEREVDGDVMMGC